MSDFSVPDASRLIQPTPSPDSVLRFLRRQRPGRSDEHGRNIRSNVAPALKPAERHDLEQFYRQRDFTDNAVRQDVKSKEALRAPDGHVPTTVWEAQVGRPLHSSEVIKRLQKLNPHLVFWRSIAFPEIMGIYVGDADAPLQSNGYRLRHVVGFEYGYSPEFTVRHPDAKSAKKMTKGWRLLLLQLAACKLINFERACQLFEVSKGEARHDWALATGQRSGLASTDGKVHRSPIANLNRGPKRRVQTTTRPLGRSARGVSASAGLTER